MLKLILYSFYISQLIWLTFSFIPDSPQFCVLILRKALKNAYIFLVKGLNISFSSFNNLRFTQKLFKYFHKKQKSIIHILKSSQKQKKALNKYLLLLLFMLLGVLFCLQFSLIS
jgi:hypothetical protein